MLVAACRACVNGPIDVNNGRRFKPSSINNKIKPIISSIVLQGTVQLTPSGKLIILMRDNQTTGGYPRILQLSNDSINKLSQKHTGDKIHFNLIDY